MSRRRVTGEGARPNETDGDDSAISRSDWEGPGRSGASPLPELEAAKPIEARIGKFKIRTVWTLVLIFSYYGIIVMGHFYCSLIVLVLTMAVYKEVISLKRDREKDKKLPLFFFLRWYWLALTLLISFYYVSFLPSLVPRHGHGHTHEHASVAWTIFVHRYHNIIIYLAGLLGFVLFILSLRK
eukprot:GHVU01007774.1.p1 GENE.GHVU01007774.1~~GHVU01007774.1.p1  ORF type:complete len:183 (+),score=24.77 GHVU01007774.1:81-629(+)